MESMHGIYYKSTITDILFDFLRDYRDTPEILPLLEAGADVNGTDSKGNSPLMLACFYPVCDIAKLLIDWGADVNRPDPTCGWTVLHYAAFNKVWLKLIKTLVKKGANLDAKCHNGYVPIALAATMQNKDAFEMLVTFGANAFYLCSEKWTVLHFAAQHGWLSVVQASLKRHIDIDVKTGLGDTPLRIACDNSHLEVIEYLLKSGADCRVPNVKGHTPFDFLISRFYIDPIIMCIENGAYIKDNEYDVMSKRIMLREYVLKDVGACSQSIINKFNSQDLPDLYQIPSCSDNLPAIGDLKIAKWSEMALEVKRAAAQDKQVNRYVNLRGVSPIVLRMMCVKSLLSHYQSIAKRAEVLEKMKELKIKK